MDGRAVEKAGALAAADAEITVDDQALKYVSRGALKLAPAIDAFGYEVSSRVCLDIGASTGGFTDLLLQRGAGRVYAVDVGKGQLAPTLMDDPRVIPMENTDARALDAASIPSPVEAIVADVSFISLAKALPAAMALAAPGCWLLALVKPQFEAGPDAVGKGGIVRDEATRQAAVENVRSWFERQPGWIVDGVNASTVAGSDGNQEYLLGARYVPSNCST